MSAFASKTPRDLNHDPEPYRYNNNNAIRRSIETMPVSKVHYTLDPRREYDHPQHNEPNPVLVRFREIGDTEFPASWVHAMDCLRAFGGYREWDHPLSFYYVLTTATESQIGHAYRVLSRLGEMAEATS